MNKIVFFLGVVTALFSLNFAFAQDCAGRYQADIFSSVEMTTVQFGANVTDGGDSMDLFMDVYQATDDTLEQNRPLVLLAFGGSFTGGVRTSGELVFMANELAKKGYVVASIDYRVTSNIINLLSEENMVKVVFGAVQDGKAAIRYFRADAAGLDTYRIDPDQIFMGGTSAGGILAMNLAYVNSYDVLPEDWQQWTADVGGLEGNSGNPGYCSYLNGVFGFAGAVGDTSYIDAQAVPCFSSHATGDQTVLYGFGAPLNGFAPVDLYGSSLVKERLDNLGIHNVLDTYAGGDHPPLAGSNAIMTETKDNLAAFLFSILDCNANNEKNADQRDCADFVIEEPPVAIFNVMNTKNLQLYPNPTQGVINFQSEEASFELGVIYNTIGAKVQVCTADELNSGSIQVSSLAKGMYILKLQSTQGTYTGSFSVK